MGGKSETYHKSFDLPANIKSLGIDGARVNHFAPAPREEEGKATLLPIPTGPYWKGVRS
jgi:hypothetical protein